MTAPARTFYRCRCMVGKPYGDEPDLTALSDDLCPLHAAAPAMLRALEAIRARIQGEWDHPALVDIGPLGTDTEDDVVGIARAAIAKAKS